MFGVLLFVLWGVHAKPTNYGAGILFDTTSVFHNVTWYAFALASLLGIFTLVGFELAADMSENAVNPVRSMPRGVLWAWATSVVLGHDRAARLHDRHPRPRRRSRPRCRCLPSPATGCRPGW